MRPENRARLSPQDVVLASHPGSGTSWLGTLLVELGLFYASGHDELLNDEVQQATGGWLEEGPASRPEVGLPRPTMTRSERAKRLTKLHDRDRREAPYREPLRIVLSNDSALGWTPPGRVVLLVRDGRDAVLSLYHHLRSFTGLELDLERFLSGNNGAFPEPARAWAFSTLSWLGAIPKQRRHLVRFEDARERPVEVFGELLRFLGVERNQAELRAAIEASSYRSMREREDRELTAGGGPLKPARVMRSGTVEGWRGELSAEQSEIFWGLAGRVLDQLGYRP